MGAALIRRGTPPDEDLLATWLDRHPTGNQARREAGVEREVRRRIGAMPFVWIGVPGRADRDCIETSSIALLSCLAGGPDQPSAGWLGRHAERPEICQSEFLQLLAQLAERPR